MQFAPNNATTANNMLSFVQISVSVQRSHHSVPFAIRKLLGRAVVLCTRLGVRVATMTTTFHLLN
jgi:hypothetical protein